MDDKIDRLLSDIPASDLTAVARSATGDGTATLSGTSGIIDDCTVYGMPKAVIENQLVDRILPLGKIAPAIARHVRRSRRSSEKGS